eukprot:364034-Chlamydomonas_euryale.AAC.2
MPRGGGLRGDQHTLPVWQCRTLISTTLKRFPDRTTTKGRPVQKQGKRWKVGEQREMTPPHCSSPVLRSKNWLPNSHSITLDELLRLTSEQS